MSSDNSQTSLDKPAPLDTILVVEDIASNIDILIDVLADDYSVSVALDGASALNSVESVKPDLILLDVMMPGMDGYEVCARLKEKPSTCDIPVIFLTALADEEDEQKGLRLGAVDYITKPFNPGLVKTRVKNHLALRRAQLETARQRDQVKDAYARLMELEQLRDNLVHMIVHDMRSPLQVIKFFLADLSPEQAGSADFVDTLEAVREVGEELYEMVNSLLDVSRLEAGKMPLHCEYASLETIAQNLLSRLGGLTKEHTVAIRASDSPVQAWCDPAIAERIFQNLVCNAVKFTPPGGSVFIDIRQDSPWAVLSVIDTGPGIPLEYQKQVFQKFGQVEAHKESRKHSTGLGLTFCKLAVEAHGGVIQLESATGKGSAFHVRLPGNKP